MKRELIKNVAVVALAVLMLTPGRAQAEIITFGVDAHLLVDDGPLTEGSFTYEATVGTSWEIQTELGNPPAALASFFGVITSDEGYEVEFARTDDGLFTFDSVDFMSVAPSGSDQLLFSGFLGNSLIGTLPLEYSDSFQTVLSGIAGAIDRLTLEVTFHNLLGPSAGAMVDNLVLTPVPEPSTIVLWLVASALALSFGWRRTRRAG